MGEARTEKARKARTVTFDFAAPAHRVLRADQLLMAREPDGHDVRDTDGTIDQRRVRSRATCSVIVVVVDAAYPQPGRMRPRDGEDYDVWLEAMHEIDAEASQHGAAPYEAPVTVGDLEWLAGHLKNDGLGVPSGMVQWRQAVRRYVEALLVAAPEVSPSDADHAPAVRQDGAGVPHGGR